MLAEQWCLVTIHVRIEVSFMAHGLSSHWDSRLTAKTVHRIIQAMHLNVIWSVLRAFRVEFACANYALPRNYQIGTGFKVHAQHLKYA
jgi:hypothetical protein